jgi:Mce-associated membrane protein
MTDEVYGSDVRPSSDVTPRAGRVVQVGVLLGVVLVAALGLAAERGLAWREAERREQARADVVKAAEDEVVGLITISALTTDEDLGELIEGATATFRDDLRDQADRLRQEVVENEVEATGEVVSTGVVSLEDETATVIVAARGTVKNRSAREPEPRSYRLEVELQEVEGSWLVSALRFVA